VGRVGYVNGDRFWKASNVNSVSIKIQAGDRAIRFLRPSRDVTEVGSTGIAELKSNEEDNRDLPWHFSVWLCGCDREAPHFGADLHLNIGSEFDVFRTGKAAVQNQLS
jgi:hypothetical protein